MTSVTRVGIPLAAVVSAVALAACGAPSTANSSAKQADLTTPKEKSGTLTMVTKFADPKYAPYFVDVTKAYEAANPGVKIQLEQVGDQPYKDKIRVLSASKKLPDIYFSWAGDFANKFVRANLAADLTSVVGPDTEWGKTFTPAALKAFQQRRQALRRPHRPRRQVHGLQQEGVREGGHRQPARQPRDAAGRLRQAEVDGLHADRAWQPVRLAGHPLHDPAQRVCRGSRTPGQGLQPGHRCVHRPRLRRRRSSSSSRSSRSAHRRQAQRPLPRGGAGQFPERQGGDALPGVVGVPRAHDQGRRAEGAGRQLGLLPASRGVGQPRRHERADRCTGRLHGQRSEPERSPRGRLPEVHDERAERAEADGGHRVAQPRAGLGDRRPTRSRSCRARWPTWARRASSPSGSTP